MNGYYNFLSYSVSNFIDQLAKIETTCSTTLQEFFFI